MKNKIQFSERQIQDQIWKYKDKFWEIIDEFEHPVLFDFEKDETSIESVTAPGLIYNIIIQKMTKMYEELNAVYLFGQEVTLGGARETKIRADILGKSEGSPGFYIFELKKDGQTERQAFTELLAYAHQINSKFPSHCIDDNVFILITPLSGKTVKDAFLQQLIFDQRKICILQPYLVGHDDIGTLRLKPFMPSQEEITVFSDASFKKRNFDVNVFCWQYEDTFWNPPAGDGQNRVNMNRVSAYAAQLMEAKNIHGFVYAQQSYPEFRTFLPLINKLVIVGLNPYQIASDSFYYENYPDITKEHEPPRVSGSANELDLTDILPGLKKFQDIHSEWNYLADFSGNWTSHLHRVGHEAVNAATLNKQNIKLHSEGVFGGTFELYELNAIENIYVFNYDFRPTGIIRELYAEMTRLDYNHWNKYQSHPYYGDSYAWAIENAESYILFEKFLTRIFTQTDMED